MSEWYELQHRPSIKRPPNANYRHYCYECSSWAFMRRVGAAIDGRCHYCDAIRDGVMRDAYEQACGAFMAGRHADEIDTDGGHE